MRIRSKVLLPCQGTIFFKRSVYCLIKPLIILYLQFLILCFLAIFSWFTISENFQGIYTSMPLFSVWRQRTKMHLRGISFSWSLITQMLGNIMLPSIQLFFKFYFYLEIISLASTLCMWGQAIFMVKRKNIFL